MQSDARALMEDGEVFGDMQQPTAGYLFAEELDIHFLALEEFHSMLLQDSAIDTSNCTQPTASMDCVSPSSPSSVMYLPPCEDSDNTCPSPKHDPYAPAVVFPTSNTHAVIKPELAPTQTYPHPVPVPVILDDIVTDDEDKERLRRRQRGYEKRYRGRKRRDLKTQRDMWLALEMKLDDARRKVCRPYVRVETATGDLLRVQVLLLKLEERALRQDRIAMRSLQAWEEISRIREYSDKNQLRTASEWQHSADKVIGRCAVLGPRRFHPYAPMGQRHFIW
uniref:BZIP domain-containing protein n=1 Tax=Peronospora matthiolae TaxID=2874970 RepID=A0AAV1U4T9_9STRA